MLIGELYRYLVRQGPIALSRGVPYARCVEYPAVVSRLELTAQDRLLDVGSRYSPFPQVLALQYGCTVRAVDPEPDFRARQLGMARRHRRARGLVDEGRLDFLVADAGRLEFPDDSFTKIAAISVLEHIEDEALVVRELARVLAPGGRLVVSVPFDPWRDEPKYYRRNVYVTGSQRRREFFQRYYSAKNLRDRIVEPSGLRLIDTAYYGEPRFNAHNLVFGNPKIPWPVRRVFLQPWAPILAPVFIRPLEPEQFRHKSRMYTADVAVLVLTKGAARPVRSEDP